MGRAGDYGSTSDAGSAGGGVVGYSVTGVVDPSCAGGNAGITTAVARSAGCCGYCTLYMIRTASWILPST